MHITDHTHTHCGKAFGEIQGLHTSNPCCGAVLTDGPKLSGSQAGLAERLGNTVVAEVLAKRLGDPVSSCVSLALRPFMNPQSPKSKLSSQVFGAAALNFQ